eukprot:687509-Pleurochrysis_carterae.AAC.1
MPIAGDSEHAEGEAAWTPRCFGRGERRAGLWRIGFAEKARTQLFLSWSRGSAFFVFAQTSRELPETETDAMQITRSSCSREHCDFVMQLAL